MDIICMLIRGIRNCQYSIIISSLQNEKDLQNKWWDSKYEDQRNGDDNIVKGTLLSTN